MAIGRTYSVGIDIGTNQVKVVVADYPDKDLSHGSSGSKNSSAGSTNHDRSDRGDRTSEKPERVHGFGSKLDPNSPRIVGIGLAETKGMRHGYVTNISEVAKSIRQAVDQAQKNTGAQIKRAFVSIGGIGLGAIIASGIVNTTKADSEITDLDVKRAIEESEKELPHTYIQNRKIIHTIPLDYRIDGKRVPGKPQGLKGLRLEARVLYITSQAHHLSDILEAMDEAGVQVIDVIASPIAASTSTLNKTQKIAGCILANIGSETSSIIVFENTIPVSLEVFPFGSNDVTNDIALGLKVSLEDAERIKLGNDNGILYSKKKLDEIIIARLSDIFDLIDDHLQRIDRSGLLPGGIILTGGGAHLPNIEELARMALHLPAKQAKISIQGNIKGVSKENEWAVAYGLALLGLGNDDSPIVGIQMEGSKIFSDFFKALFQWFKKFLP